MSDISAIRGETPLEDAARILAELISENGAGQAEGADQLLRAAPPLVPEIQLYLAVDAVVLWARMNAHATGTVGVPFWASAWAGSQGLARYLLDDPQRALGRRVLDIASGSGLAAIAAAIAGGEVVANDIDPFAVAAIDVNADLNGVKVTSHLGDLLSGDGDDVDLALVGDAFNNVEVADAMLPFLRRIVANGGEVLIGDPGRGHLPREGLAELATYRHEGIGVLADLHVTEVTVFRLVA